MAVTYTHLGREWSFRALPALPQTAEIYLAMSALMAAARKGKAPAGETMLGLIAHLPWAIATALESDHSPDEIEAFQRSVRLDFHAAETGQILADLNQLFLGVDPRGKSGGPPTDGG